MKSFEESVDDLIAYWLDSDTGSNHSSATKDLARQLAQSTPAPILRAVQGDPLRYRAEVERMLRRNFERTELTLTPELAGLAIGAAQFPEEHRQAVGQPGPPAPIAAPESDRNSSPAVVGDGNLTFRIGDVPGQVTITGSHVVKTPSRPREPSSVARDLKPSAPVRILFLGANPRATQSLQLDEEVRAIDQALSGANLSGHFELFQKWAVRVSEIEGYLLRHKPAILHFSGHGSKAQGIILEGEGGQGHPVSAERLARFLGQFNQHLRCVVLNACYSEEQAKALAQEIDCVIGMRSLVDDRGAVRFAAAFYQAIAYGKSLQAAFDLACSDIELGELRQDDRPAIVAVRSDPRSLILGTS